MVEMHLHIPFRKGPLQVESGPVHLQQEVISGQMKMIIPEPTGHRNQT